MARYWVVSANIGNKSKDSASLRFWTEAVLRNHSAYMGWPPDTRIGKRFTEIHRGDVILIGHGSMENHGADRRLVACGVVEARRTGQDRCLDDSGVQWRENQYAVLAPFLPLDEDPIRCRTPRKDTTHDDNPQPQAVFELKPDDPRHPGNRALCDWLDRMLNREQTRNPRGNQPTSVIAKSVKLDADANSEAYEVEQPKQVIQARKREQQLVNEFVATLERRNITADRLRYSSSEGIFYCDVYIIARGHLIEAKGSTSRGDVRMAIGQLFDYRHLTQKAGKRISRLAVLLPERPAHDIEALLTSLTQTLQVDR